MLTCPMLKLARSMFSCLAAVEKLNQDLSQPAKTCFNQSDEVFYRSRIAINNGYGKELTRGITFFDQFCLELFAIPRISNEKSK